jgi:RNA polymerase sigma-70 factor (ECF subfamily)
MTQPTDAVSPPSVSANAPAGASTVSEAELLGQLRDRSPTAFEQLVRTHGVALMATTRRILRDEHEANDALQETFVSAFRAMERFDGRCPLGAWLQQIAVNACLMKLRSRRRRGEVEVEELLPQFTTYGQFAEHQERWSTPADSTLERGETAELVRAAIDRLPDKFRLPLVLRDLEGLDYALVAERLGATPNAAKIRVHRARQALRALLEPHMKEHL